MKTALFTLLALALALVVSSIAQDKGRSFGDGALPPLLVPYDVNQDGKLSEEEYQVMLDERDDRREAARSAWDNDGDGQLSEEELRKAHEENLRLMVAKREQRFQEVDLNDDNKLSREEFARVPGIEALEPSVVEAVFTRLDDDGDQLVGIWEFLEALEDRPSENTAHDYGKAEAVALEDLPPAVADALFSQVPNIVLERAKTREEDGELIYEVRGNDGITEVKAKIASDGSLRELELDAEISEDNIPQAVLTALQELVGDFVIEKAETDFENGLVYYEIEGHAGGREFEADFVADGRLVELEIEDAKDGGDGDDPNDGDDPEGDDGEDPEGDDGEDPEGDDGEGPNGDDGEDPEGDGGEGPNGDDGDDPEGDDGDDPEGDDGDDPNEDDGDDPNEDDGDDPNEDDPEISEDNIPQAVLTALQELVGDFVIEKAETDFENGLVYYEIEGHAGGREFEADFVADGRLVELEIEDAKDGGDGDDPNDGDDPEGDDGEDPEGDDGEDPEGDDGEGPNGDDGEDPEGDGGEGPNGDDGDDPEGDDGDDPNEDDPNEDDPNEDDPNEDDGDDPEGDDGDDPNEDGGDDPKGDDGEVGCR